MPNFWQLNRPFIRHILLAAISYSAIAPVVAKEVNIAFIDDDLGESNPRLSQLIVQELKPLLSSTDSVKTIFLGDKGQNSDPVKLSEQAQRNVEVDYIVATGFIGSQAIYTEAKFTKPTYLLRVLDPRLTGSKIRDKTPNLRSYSTTNEIVDVFSRLQALFGVKSVGIVLPVSAANAQRSTGSAVMAAAAQAKIEAKFIAVDFSQAIAPQLAGIDSVVLPPLSYTEGNLNNLIATLQRLKLPSFAVGGDSMVHKGVLISDTLNDEIRVLARRVALDLQLAISGESATSGMRWLEPKRRTIINMDTARAIGANLSLDELMSARIVQSNDSGLSLGFSSTLQLATERNLNLRAQTQQLNIAAESLEQARATRRPQLSASITQNFRGEQLPERDTRGALGLSQIIYSPTANANLEVSKLRLESSSKTLEQQKLDTVQQTASVYFQALQTQAQFETGLRDLALNRDNLELAERRKRSGDGTGADVYRWQATIAASEIALLRAYTTNTSAQNQLAQVLNTRLRTPTLLADVDLDQPPFDLLHEHIEPYLQSTGAAEHLRNLSVARALNNSPQLESAIADVATNKTNIDALKRAYYTPELSLSGQLYHYLHSSDNTNGVALDGDHDWSASINAEIPLWLGGQRSSLLRQHQARESLASTQLQSLRIALWASTDNAVNDLVTNFRAINLSKEAETAALKSYQIIQRAYQLGSSTVTELQDTQNSYLQAQNEAHIARYQYLTALVDFQTLIGEMPMLKPGAEQQQWLQDFLLSMPATVTQKLMSFQELNR